MRHLNFTAESKRHLNQSNWTYKIANTPYHSHEIISALHHLIDSQCLCDNISTNTSIATQNPCCLKVYSDTCSIGEQKYALEVTTNNKNDYLIRNNEDTYFITKNNIDSNTNGIDVNLLLGPALILNLALNTTYCFHASAFILKNKICLLMADSGTGKSTIARYINKHSSGKRIADDIVPLQINNGKISVLADFPQLKLPPEQQYHGEPIQKHVVLLFAKKTFRKTQIHKINAFHSLKKLIQHSVATKLFATNELQNHLDFCFQISQNAQAYQVEYAHTENSLHNLLCQINEIL